MAADLSASAALLYRSGVPKDYPFSDGAVSIGYDSGNQIRVRIEGVSRRHAKITFDGTDYWIEDAGSSNGTFLNGVAVVGRERLRHLDIVSLGRRTDLIFVRKAIAGQRARRIGIVAAWLLTVDGPDAGERREIPRGAITLGRTPSNNVVVNSQLVSKAHARIERLGVELILTDLQSANGTFIDGKPVTSRTLEDGDEFNLGKARIFRVQIQEGEIETSRVNLAPAVDHTTAGLPTEWKTRLDWTPEEKAVLERVRSEAAAKAEAVAKPPAAAKPAVKAAAPKPEAGSAEQAKPKLGKEEPEKRKPSDQPKLEEPAKAPIPKEPAAPAAAPLAPAAQASQSPVAPSAPPPRVAAQPQTTPLSPPPKISPAEQQQAPRAAERRVSLVGKTQSFAVGIGDHVIGRVEPSELLLESPQVSRRHAILRVSAQEASIEDLSSANGVFINGKRISARQPLADGDLIEFGDLGFRVRFGS